MPGTDSDTLSVYNENVGTVCTSGIEPVGKIDYSLASFAEM